MKNRLKRDESTFQVDFLGTSLIFYIVLLLLLFSLVGEIGVRMIAGHSILGIPSVGSEDRVFESRLSLLDSYAAGRGSIDCVIFGDSTVMTDFAPGPFQDAFREVTGQNIECFNFGVGAFMLVEIEALAQIVSEEYSPKLIIVGVEAQNLKLPSLDSGHEFEELPWAQYRLGRFNIEGWLYSHSDLFRHLNSIRMLVTMEKSPTEMIRDTTNTYNIYHNGFYSLDESRKLDVSQPPDPSSEHPYPVAYFNSHSGYKLLPEQLKALDKIIALNNSTTQVVIVEMPVPDTFISFFDNGEQDYDLFINAVEKRVAGTFVPFWTTTDLQLVPYELWHNYNHLSAEGAPIFSDWLGNQLGLAILDGTVSFAEETNN